MGCAHSTDSVDVPSPSALSLEGVPSHAAADRSNELRVCAVPELAEAYLELEVAKSDASDGAEVDEHPSDLVRKHIAKCVVRALKRHGINGDADQFTPFPVPQKEIEDSSLRCRAWADEVVPMQQQLLATFPADLLSPSRKSSRSDISGYFTVDMGSSDSQCTIPGSVDAESDGARKSKWPTLTPYLIEKLQQSF